MAIDGAERDSRWNENRWNWGRRGLQGVDKVRSLVTKKLCLASGHALNPIISLASASESVLPSEQSIHESRAAEEANDHVSHDS